MAGESRSSAAAAPVTPRARRRRGVSLASRLAATVLGVGLISLVAATLVGVNAGQSLGRGIIDRSLETQRTAGALETESQLRYYQRLAEQLADSSQTSVALTDFAAGLQQLESLSTSDVRGAREELIEAYRETLFEPLQESGEALQIDDVLSTYPPALYLQALYTLPEPPVSNPISVDDAGDGSDWSAAHAQYHSLYRAALTQGGLRDIYLVEAVTGRIVYTSAKGPDLGTSLDAGPYSGSIVSRAAAAAAESETGVVTDLSYYRGVPGVPLGAAAAAVRDGSRLLGGVVITYDGEIYAERLTAMAEASTPEGQDEIRDLYLIGPNGRTRSDPQTYLDNPTAYLDAAAAAGVLTEEERTAIERAGTTVLILRASDSTVNAAQDDTAAVMAGTSITGAEIVTTVEELPVEDIRWSIAAEAGVATAEATVTDFRRILLFGAAAFVVALAFAAVAWAKAFMRPVRVISERLGTSARVKAASATFEVDQVKIPDRSPIEFHRLADTLTAMGRSLYGQQLHLRDARAERLRVLERMLPASIAQRIARGDIEGLDTVPSATVVVAVVLGLGNLVDAGRSDRRLLDELHAELDGIALEHGLDRIKVVGDAYFGACGHDRPFIDHAPRAVAFAEATTEAVRRLARRAHAPLDTAIGINTGPVTVGMSGGAHLIYDVWGPTVTTAHALARSADAGQIVLMEATRTRLPAEIEVVPWHPHRVAAGQEWDYAKGQVWAVAGGPDEARRATEAEAAP